jgi:hypothetical protein
VSRNIDKTIEVVSELKKLLADKYPQYPYEIHRWYSLGGGTVEINIDAPFEIIKELNEICYDFRYGALDHYGNYTYFHNDDKPRVKYIIVRK